MSLPFTYPREAVLLPVSLLDFGDRTRTHYPDLENLANSILTAGLIHPPTINLSNRLIAGGRRCRAMIDILKVTHIPVVFLETADEAHIRLLEDQENYQRINPPWPNRVMGIYRFHTAHVVESRLEHKAKWTLDMTGACLNQSQANISNILSLVPYIQAQDAEVLACSGITDALRLLLKRKEEQATALLTAAVLPTITSRPAQQSGSVTDGNPAAPKALASLDMFGFGGGGFGVRDIDPTTIASAQAPAEVDEADAPPVDEIDFSKLVFLGDSIAWMNSHPGCCDHIVTDIPYGIDMDNLQQENTGMDVSSTAKEHDVDSNCAMFKTMFPAMFTALKDNGFAVLWCDMQHWWNLAELAREAGFSVQRWPLVWQKAYPCLNQAAGFNFTKNYEVALVLRKGTVTLAKKQPVSIYVCDNPDKAVFNHPFAKPLALWNWIYDAITIQGQIVLDPFAGSGTASVAAIRRGLIPLAVELNEAHYNNIIQNLRHAVAK